MKKTIAAIAATLLLVCALVSCGGATKASKVTGIYLSPAKLSYNNMRPTYNYYLTTFAQQELTLNDDGTYCLLVSSSTFSALILAEDTSDASGNERTNSITKVYGTYTSTPNAIDDDLTDVALSAPTRVLCSYDQTYWYDTDNWTDEMSNKVKAPVGYDQTTGAAIYDENAKGPTAEEFLASFKFKAQTIQVNNKTASFDFTDFGM
ncbi:MAG: hypothetical protein J6Z23_00290 [Lachnospiraceae bacterium]|nr:hypothetical protein [Lachnospiraceae bacterium]MBP5253824.1 hypothetical protein [Lachnospiraceae bacterium]